MDHQFSSFQSFFSVFFPHNVNVNYQDDDDDNGTSNDDDDDDDRL